MPAQQQPQPGKPDRDGHFARIVAEHARFLYRVAHSVLRHPQDAEDAVQDALLKLYRGNAWQHMQNERAFLARVVWRAALDKHTSRSVTADDGADLRIVDARPTPERHLADGDERALLRELIEELPADLRETLLLSAIEEMNSRQVGELMNIPEGTVRTRLMRARAELREKFAARGRPRLVHEHLVTGTRSEIPAGSGTG